MKKYNILVSSFFILCFQLNLAAQAPKHEDVKKEVTTVLRAPYENNFDLLITHLHPKIIEVSGGRDNFKEIIVQVFSKIKSADVNFVSAKVSAPYLYMRSEKREFFLVDVVLTLSKGEEKTLNKLTQIAIKDKDARVWSYTDASGMTNETLRTLFPDTPKEFTLDNAAEAEKKEQNGPEKELVPQL